MSSRDELVDSSALHLLWHKVLLILICSSNRSSSADKCIPSWRLTRQTQRKDRVVQPLFDWSPSLMPCHYRVMPPTTKYAASRVSWTVYRSRLGALLSSALARDSATMQPYLFGVRRPVSSTPHPTADWYNNQKTTCSMNEALARFREHWASASQWLRQYQTASLFFYS